MRNKYFAFILLIIVAVASRLLPHPWNWTALGATALVAGGRSSKFLPALIVPLLALFISDLVLGFHITMVSVYGAMIAISIAAYAAREKLHGKKIIIGALSASVVFYLVTNFGVWLSGGMYPPTGAGIVECYIAGLPFLASQALGDLFYAGILFTVWDRVFFPSSAISAARDI